MTGHESQKYQGEQGAFHGADPRDELTLADRPRNADRPDTPSSDNPDEIFDLVDERDKVIGSVRRGDAHHDPSLLHRSVQVLVFNDQGEVLLQRRSPHKDLFPNYYCASASGHLNQGEDYAEAAEREAREELGVALDLTQIGKVLLRTPRETEMTAIFVAQHEGPFTFSPTETRGGDFFTLAALRAGFADGTVPMTPALLAALDAVGARLEEPHEDRPEQ